MTSATVVYTAFTPVERTLCNATNCCDAQWFQLQSQSTRRPLRAWRLIRRGARSVVTAGLWSARPTGVWSVPWKTSFIAFCRNLKHPVLIVFQNRRHARTHTHATAQYDVSVSLRFEGQWCSPSPASQLWLPSRISAPHTMSSLLALISVVSFVVVDFWGEGWVVFFLELLIFLAGLRNDQLK